MPRKYGQQFPAHAYDPATSRIYLSDSGTGPMGWMLADDLPFQPLDADLTAIAALATDAFGRSLLEQATAEAVRNLIGAGTGDGDGDALTSASLDQFADVTQASGKTLAITESTTLAGGSHSGTNTGDQDLSGLQPLDGTLTALAGLTIAANSLTIGTAADTFQQTTFAANTFPARASTGDLVAKSISDFALTMLDDADAAAVRSTIGAGTGSGNVSNSGTPAENQVAIWAAAAVAKADPNLTWDGTTLALANDGTNNHYGIHFSRTAPEVAVGRVENGAWVRLTGNKNRALLCGNTYYDGTVKYSQTGGGGEISFDITTGATAGDFVVATLPSGTADTTAARTERLRVKQAGQVVLPSTGTLNVCGTTQDGKAFVKSTTAFSKTSTGHGLTVGGEASGKNLVLGVRSTDGAGLAARDNGNNGVLYLNPDGGNVKVGGPLYSDDDLIAANGKNVRVGAATVGTSGTNCLAIASGTAPGTNPDACFRATGGEMYVRDTAGNQTLLSPHRADGPPALYDFPGLDRVQPSAQSFVGEIEWINLSRLARKVDELTTKGKNPCIIRESFADFNKRLKLKPGDADFQVMIYQEDHDAAVAAGCALALDAAGAKVKRWKDKQFDGELSPLGDVPHFQPRPLFKWAKRKGV